MVELYEIYWRPIWSSNTSRDPQVGVDWLKNRGVAVAALVAWPSSQVPGSCDTFPSNGVLHSYRVALYDRGGFFIVVRDKAA